MSPEASGPLRQFVVSGLLLRIGQPHEHPRRGFRPRPRQLRPRRRGTAWHRLLLRIAEEFGRSARFLILRFSLPGPLFARLTAALVKVCLVRGRFRRGVIGPRLSFVIELIIDAVADIPRVDLACVPRHRGLIAVSRFFTDRLVLAALVLDDPVVLLCHDILLTPDPTISTRGSSRIISRLGMHTSFFRWAGSEANGGSWAATGVIGRRDRRLLLVAALLSCLRICPEPRIPRSPRMLLPAVWTPRRADCLRHPLKGGIVGIDARGKSPPRCRASQDQHSHLSLLSEGPDATRHAEIGARAQWPARDRTRDQPNPNCSHTSPPYL